MDKTRQDSFVLSVLAVWRSYNTAYLWCEIDYCEISHRISYTTLRISLQERSLYYLRYLGFSIVKIGCYTFIFLYLSLLMYGRWPLQCGDVRCSAWLWNFHWKIDWHCKQRRSVQREQKYVSLINFTGADLLPNMHSYSTVFCWLQQLV